MRRNVTISRNRSKIERLLDWKELPSKSVGRFSFQCLTGGLPVGLLLLRYSVLFTVESLSLLYLLFISWFTCSILPQNALRRDYNVKCIE